MPSYKDDPPDQEYLESIRKHTSKETNKVNLALVAKDFGYASGKSFQKKYAKLKKARKLTNGHVYGDNEISSSEAAPTEVTQTHPNETIKATKSFMNIVNEHIKANLAQLGVVEKSRTSGEKQKKHSKGSPIRL